MAAPEEMYKGYPMTAPSRFVGRVLDELPSRSAVVDLDIFERNCKRMYDRAKAYGVELHPQFKTHKSMEAAKIMTKYCDNGVTVSRIEDAEIMATTGIRSITYCTAVAPHTAHRLAELQQKVEDLRVVIDTPESLEALVRAHPNHPDYAASVKVGRSLGYAPTEEEKVAPVEDTVAPFKVMILVDTGYHREGVNPESDASLALAKAVVESKPYTCFGGLYVHNSMTYNTKGADSEDVIKKVEEKNSGFIRVASGFKKRLEEAGISVGIFAAGATPQCSSSKSWEDVNEWHPGNYVFYDRQQEASGSCSAEDIAFGVTARIVALYPARNEFLVDAGYTAMTIDKGGIEDGYDTVVGSPELRIVRISQEVAVVSSTGPIDFSKLKLSKTLMFSPGHSCAAASMHTRYFAVRDGKVEDVWYRVLND